MPGFLQSLVGALGYREPPDLGPIQPDMLPPNSPTARIPITLEAQAPPQQTEEDAFRQWYGTWAARYGMDPDPDAPDQHYDYRAAFKAGVQPPNLEAGEHWPSTFKDEEHPNLVVGGFHTQTGERVPGTPRAPDAEALIQLGWDPATAQQLVNTPELPLPATAQPPSAPTMPAELRPDPGAPRERPPVIPGPGSVIGAATGLPQAGLAGFLGGLLDQPGDLGHATEAAWRAMKGVPATVYQPFGEQAIPSLSSEYQQRGVPVSELQALPMDVLGDPLNVVGDPVSDVAKLALMTPKLAGMAAVTAMDLIRRSKQAAELAETVARRFPRFAAALREYAPTGFRVFHGSPHSFERFDVSKIGTGEGAQAYGHGLYFAEEEDIAKFYRDALARGDQLVVRVPGQAPLAGDAIDDIGLDAVKFLEIGRQHAGEFPHNTAYYATKAADSAAAGLPGAAARNTAVKERIAAWKDAQIGYEPVKGHVYAVDIQSHPEHFLDWDKPLSEQPPKVREALKTLTEQSDVSKRYSGWDVYFEGDTAPFQRFAHAADARQYVNDLRAAGGKVFVRRGFWGQSGSSLYESLVEAAGGDGAKASAALNRAGIPGIRYLDQASRRAGQGTRNYVVFDDALAAIQNPPPGIPATITGMPKKWIEVAVDDIEHGEAAMPGGTLSWPDAAQKVEDYANRRTPIPPIDAIPPEFPGEKWMVEDGSRRLEAARLRGDKTIRVNVERYDPSELPLTPPQPPTAGIPAGVAVEEQSGHLRYAPAARSERGHLVVSGRVPFSAQPAEALEGLPLVANLDELKKAPKTLAAIADRLRDSPRLTRAEARLPPEALIETFVERVKTNLLRLWDETSPEIRQHARQWYEGAHARAVEDAKAFGLSQEQSSAVLAVLSPQKDWFENAEQGRRVIATWRKLTDINPVFTRDVFDQYWAIVFKGDTDAVAALPKAQREMGEQLIALDRAQQVRDYVNKPFKDLSVEGKAAMIQALSQTLDPREFPMILPNGAVGPIVRNADQTTADLSWGLRGPLFKAVSVLEDGSWANISAQLGAEHKVRAFFNNINDPWHAGFATIDTHAVAAAHWMPFAQDDREVLDVMKGSKSAALGIRGSNPVYQEAYARAAAARGVLPREMQSVTWEAVRGLFSPAQKSDAKLMTHIKSLWEQHNTGKLSLEQVYDRILKAAGGINEPDWAAHVLSRPAR